VLDPHIISNFALQRHVGNQTLARLGIDPRHVPGIRIPIGVSVFHVEEKDEVVTSGDRRRHGSVSLLGCLGFGFIGRSGRRLLVFVAASKISLVVIAENEATLLL
jgi:hypothetical protein